MGLTLHAKTALIFSHDSEEDSPDAYWLAATASSLRNAIRGYFFPFIANAYLFIGCIIYAHPSFCQDFRLTFPLLFRYGFSG